MSDFIQKHKKLLIGLAVAIVVLGGVGAFAIANSGNSKDTSINETYTVQYGNIESSVTGKGYVQAGREVKILAPTGVTVEEVLVKPGDSVGAGQALANIEPNSISVQLANAISTETDIQKQLDSGNLSTSQRDALYGQRDEVRSYISQLRDLQAYPVITSPQNGIINNVYLIDGAPVTVQNTSSPGSSGSQDTSSSGNTNVSLFSEQTAAQTVNPISFKINPLFFLKLGFFLNSQQILPILNSASFSVPDTKVNLNAGATKQKGINTYSDTIKVSDGDIPESSEETEIYEETIESQYEDSFINGRSDFKPDTSSSNIENYEEYIIDETEQTPQQSSQAQSSGSDQSNIKQVADFVTYDAVAFKLGSMDQLTVNAMIDERDIMALQVGQEAKVELEALPDEELTGNIKSISSTAQTGTGNSKYSVEITLNTDKNLKSGMTADVTVGTGSNQNVLIIPVNALQETAGRKFVYTSESDDGTLGTEVDVTTGLSNKDYVEITSGLKSGMVIYYPSVDKDLNLLEDAGDSESENTESTEASE